METLHIFKTGGKVIEDPEMLAGFLNTFATIDGPKILIHGGGKTATELASKLGVPQQFNEGRRITDAATLDIAVMVYAGLINKRIVASLQSLGCNAIGLCGADGNSVRTKKRTHPQIDYGLVGDADPESVNRTFLSDLLDKGVVPVFCAITHDGDGNLLNTNADTMAAEIACALSEQYETELTYCFEHSGVLRDIADETSLLPKMDPAIYAELKSSGAISDGMIPKLDNAFAAMERGVKKVVICRADRPGKGTTLIRPVGSEQLS
jgi:acetylglutamate kinase